MSIFYKVLSCISFRIPGVVLILVCGLLSSSSLAADTRKPNSLEVTYTALVTHGFSAQLCEKISPKALTRSLFNSRGTQIYSQRSACYFYAAATELNSAYCPLVIEAKALINDGSMFSPGGCRDFVERGKPWRANIGFANHEELLRAAGFNDDDLAGAVPGADPQMAWMDFYDYLMRNAGGQLQQRFVHLPDFSVE